MSQMHRFYLPAPQLHTGMAQLPDEEAQHASQALRLRAGDCIEVFDGEGHLAEAITVDVKKRSVSIEIQTIHEPPRPTAGLHLCCAIPKGKRWQMLVEKCTELGVASIQPVLFRWSVAEGAGDRSKWERWAIEASKQCRRLYLPAFHAPIALADCLATPPAPQRFLAAPGGATRQAGSKQNQDACILIGPEAGLADEETAAAQAAGFQPLSLGPHILRIETAAIAACALFAPQ